jgi:hypothetical protein
VITISSHTAKSEPLIITVTTGMVSHIAACLKHSSTMVRCGRPLWCLCSALILQLGSSAAIFNGAMLAGAGSVHRKQYSNCRMLTASATSTKKIVYESDTVVKQENPLVQGMSSLQHIHV